MKDSHGEKSLTPKDAAYIYGLSEGTLANLRYNKKGPRYFKVGRKVLYRIEDLESWITRQPVLTMDCR
ncbi:MAG TPA: helix-turn-helix domain-containing protein [Syntrophorhabdus sp.]|nr:helix-turn-helix domain-containing protein [Syntrophorhabdus sp.]